MFLIFKLFLKSRYICILILSLTIIYAGIIINLPIKNINEEGTISGYINEYKFDGNKLSVVIDNYKGTYYIDSISEKELLKEKIKYGQLIILEGKISIPIKNTIPNSFNYQKYLKSNNINYIISISNLQVLKNNIGLLNRVKNILTYKIDSYQSKDYIYTFVLGNKNFIDNDIMDSYRINGITHLFSLSGMHVSLFSLVILFFLNKTYLSKFCKYFITSLFLLLYMLLAGALPSILRSTIFFLLLSINKLFKLNIKTINIFILCISLILLICPWFIINISFQYSSLSSFGLIYMTNYLKKGNYFTKIIKTSFVAQLFCLPITINNFYEINLFSIFSNIIFIPLVTFIIYPLSILTLLFSSIDKLLFEFIVAMESLSSIISSINLTIIIPKISIILWIIYYLILLFKMKSYYLIMIIMIGYIRPYLDFNYHIYYLDIGQGDCSLIISPNKKEIVMIDTGGKYEYQLDDWKKTSSPFKISSNVITFIKSMGISRIDNLILSHGDIDHIGETINLNKKLKIKSVIFNKGNINNLEGKISSVIKTHHYYYQVLKIENISLDIVGEENNDSQITYLKINKFQFLFMGDLPQDREKELIRKYNLGQIYALKVGHHGSKTSSNIEFLKTINPNLAIISSGRNNRYNHPAKETINTFNQLGIFYLNTQSSGTIHLIVNDKVRIKTYCP